jgi:drug/metabolite transporter (DMT)-like permease
VVIGAFFWALHIVYVSKFLKIFDFPITIATFQCLIAAVLSAIPAISIEFVSFELLSLEAGELIYAGILSSGFAFLLQIIALQHLSPAPAAIIFSLEGVFASIAAWILLDQYLNEFKVLGIVIILIAVIFSQLAPIYGKKIYGRN